MAKIGRKGKYDPVETPKLAEEYAADLLTDAQICAKLGITYETFYKWHKKHVEFAEAVKRGKAKANVDLVKAMEKTAKGYYVEEEETVAHLDQNRQPKSFSKIVKKRYIPPSTTTQIFLAKNRMPDQFRDVNRHEITGANGQPVQMTTSYDLSTLTEDELLMLRGILVKASAKDTTDDSRN